MGFELNVLSSYEDDKLGTRDSCGNRSAHSKAQSKLITRHNSQSGSHSHMGRRLGLTFVYLQCFDELAATANHM